MDSRDSRSSTRIGIVGGVGAVGAVGAVRVVRALSELGAGQVPHKHFKILRLHRCVKLILRVAVAAVPNEGEHQLTHIQHHAGMPIV